MRIPGESSHLLRIEDLVTALGLSKRAIYNRRHRGDFPPAVRIGRSLRWRWQDVEAYLQHNTETDMAHEPQGHR